jgi:predicted transglutaminase-like protease
MNGLANNMITGLANNMITGLMKTMVLFAKPLIAVVLIKPFIIVFVKPFIVVFIKHTYVEKAAWTTDAILVFDENNDGQITSSSEIAFAKLTDTNDTDLDHSL